MFVYATLLPDEDGEFSGTFMRTHAEMLAELRERLDDACNAAGGKFTEGGGPWATTELVHLASLDTDTAACAAEQLGVTVEEQSFAALAGGASDDTRRRVGMHRRLAAGFPCASSGCIQPDDVMIFDGQEVVFCCGDHAEDVVDQRWGHLLHSCATA